MVSSRARCSSGRAASCRPRDTAQQVDLQVGDRVEVGVAHAECSLQDRGVVEQLTLAGDRQQLLQPCVRARRGSTSNSRLQLVGHQRRHVVRRDLQVGLGQCHLDVGHERPEEVPLLVHLGEHVGQAGLACGRQAGSDAEPTGHDLTRLRPAEHPRDRPQPLDAAAGDGPPRRPRADVQRAELLDRGRGEEVVGQVGVVDQPAVASRTRRR